MGSNARSRITILVLTVYQCHHQPFRCLCALHSLMRPEGENMVLGSSSSKPTWYQNLITIDDTEHVSGDERCKVNDEVVVEIKTVAEVLVTAPVPVLARTCRRRRQKGQAPRDAVTAPAVVHQKDHQPSSSALAPTFCILHRRDGNASFL
ncbi:hypothetical protein K505DRAFT_93513 [Melanomma pulvis-pyrius CBS 109.77]|uniref:Uncharacterized protein n=1 Tax=Melanomma pulvis-pyrius CBS 109.77 TaxID=1314802 RepID=A0A6A6WZF5_9PLEO|nr:hypothetical protein K505DRAFT_93513 [Melanomma pulvis-pyrius CBS 109.77]